ncbi:O-Glycosyl hydrolase [Algoriphagus locisalis]|uniref:O-Glycosyl hydrolase n=1 Tax=Algoriphagus locisalis TaxID=305507 RepID=A0A1I7BCL1_9BACT|nr:glycoside hydrolase [Algoriphagus locisalis]SFT84950.1 O-Glycosyl hydrolase [Algoriphagus locisalis]
MIYSKIKLLFFVVCGLLMSCQSSGQEQKQQDLPEEEIVTINALKNETYQSIEHFGASDAWSGQFVGLWPDQKKNGIAELLFSKENDTDGNPKGIGLSMWRFNVGAGSAQQGEESGIRDEWRRAESFLEADGTYNWDRQAGQVWFARAAQEFGVGKLLIFPNSPPVTMTKTGKAYANNGQSNLAEENFQAFGEYLTQVIMGLQQKGLKVDYVSPVNEPQWDWSDGGQEGTPFWNNEISGIVKALDKALSDENLTTKIDVAEAGKINYLYEQADKEGRGNQVADFFQPESSNYIGNLTQISPTVSAHSYFTTSPFESAVNQRERVAAAVSSVQGLSYWMSEYCILGDNGGEINGNGRDLGIDPALYIARVIHNDLTVSNASAWHWWLAISPYDYKDGLVYIDKQKEDGNYYESKMLWALGNYSRFVKPGYQRIGVEVNQKKLQNPEFLVSAYQADTKEEIVYVVVNSGIKDLRVDLTVDGQAPSINDHYVTSKDSSLESFGAETSAKGVLIPARSIVTVVARN